jgi:hypothetical protein
VSEVKAAGTLEIVGLRPADACILGVDAKAKAVDEFIDTITRTSIFSGLSREDPARVAGKLDEARGVAGRGRGQRPLVAGTRPHPMTAE